MRARTFVLLIAVTSIATMQAGIPEPDMTLFGEISVAGSAVGAQDEVSVIARVDGNPSSLVGAYKMGDNPQAGDYYVLRVRLESPADGSEQSNNAALIGQTVNIYLKTSQYLELLVGSVTVTESGATQYLDLDSDAVEFHEADCNKDGIINFKDLARVAQSWDRKDCGAGNNWCNSADIGHSTAVDFSDLSEVASSWLQAASP